MHFAMSPRGYLRPLGSTDVSQKQSFSTQESPLNVNVVGIETWPLGVQTMCMKYFLCLGMCSKKAGTGMVYPQYRHHLGVVTKMKQYSLRKS
jgi:hypothetical protein